MQLRRKRKILNSSELADSPHIIIVLSFNRNTIAVQLLQPHQMAVNVECRAAVQCTNFLCTLLLLFTFWRIISNAK